MRLRELLEGIEVVSLTIPPDTEITQVCADSRAVRKGSLFVAVNGTKCDGERYVAQAMAAGAAGVVCEGESSAPCVRVRDARSALSRLACSWYGHPAKKLTVLGVTGTNGKTTVTYLLRHILRHTGLKTGLIGTVENLVEEQAFPTQRTTPDALQLQRLLAQMAEAGCTYAVMEVSSHALVQHRVDGIGFAVGIFTNLTEDHLDYHGTMDSYCDAKARLFRMSRAAVCNADDPWTERLLAGTSCRTVLYGLHAPCDLWAEDIVLRDRSAAFTACSAQERAAVRLRVPGLFSVYNTLAAMAACGALGIPLKTCAEALADFAGVKGRMEVVPTPEKPYTVLIDYAHTPDALENVLKTVRGFAKGRLIAVFGCGGDREKEKRPLMGRIAAALADVAVVTSDNPRSEEPMAIIQDILTGIAPTGKKSIIEPDRRAAIALAMKQAGAGDVIILCGKGHETYQEIGGRMLPMDEREIVQALL